MMSPLNNNDDDHDDANGSHWREILISNRILGSKRKWDSSTRESEKKRERSDDGGTPKSEMASEHSQSKRKQATNIATETQQYSLTTNISSSLIIPNNQSHTHTHGCNVT